MTNIIVNDYPCEAKDCPFAELEMIEDEYGIFERRRCKCSGNLCVISESRFDSLSPDYDVDAYLELTEQYGYDRCAFCRDHCPYLLGLGDVLKEYRKTIYDDVVSMITGGYK